MSLKGSLETAALPEVLQFLAGTGKSGELHVDGPAGQGRLWFEAGCISGFDAGSSEEPFEAIFELLRLGQGDFSFTAGVDRPDEARVAHPDGWAVDKALEKAQARLAEWTEIVAVVPSLAHRVCLSVEAPADEVTLKRSQWEVVVAVGDGRTVSDVLVEKGLREFEGCREIRDLVEASLVEVLDPAEPAAEPEPEVGPVVEAVLEAEPEPVVESEPVAEVGPVVEAEPAVEAEAEAEAEPVVEAVSEVEAGSVADAEPVEAEQPGEYELAAESALAAALAEALGEAHEVDHADDTEHVGSVAEAAEAGDPGDDFTTSHFPVLGAPEAQAADSAADDRYAALRAAMVDLGDDLGADAAHEGPAPITIDSETDGRAALAALLEEVSGEPVAAGHDHPVDGLADRGPWTANELDAMSVWHQDGAPAASADQAVDGGYGAHFEASHYEASHYEATQVAEGDGYHVAEAGYEAGHNGYAGPEADVHGTHYANGYAEQYPAPVAAAPVAETATEAEAEVDDGAEDAPSEEPINRGLLLKFLSSVRN